MTNNIEDLNLPELSCAEFAVQGNVTLSGVDHSRIETLMLDTAHEQEDSGSLSALYGTRYNVGDGWIGGFGHLERVYEGDETIYRLTIAYRVDIDEIPPPPSDFRQVTDLMELTREMFGEIRVRCEATFFYAIDEGIQSRVQLPTPLLVAGQSSEDELTHIEGVHLSRREDGKVTYEVLVTPTEDGQVVTHAVRFHDSSVLTLGSLRQMLTVASRWSRSLLDLDSEEES